MNTQHFQIDLARERAPLVPDLSGRWRGQQTRAAQSMPLHISQAMATFLLDAQARRLTASTLSFYRYQLQPFIAFLAEHDVVWPEHITPHHIRAYLVVLQRRGLKDNSVHAAARAIRRFCRFLVVEGLIPINPMQNVEMPRRAKHILPALDASDVEKLLQACTHARDGAIVLFLLDTGCRASELTNLNVGDVNIDADSVLIREGKGRKDREVFIGRATARQLVRYYRERDQLVADDPLWLSLTTGERLTNSGLQLMLRRLGSRAGVPHCHPHTFRRTCALWSLRAGMDIYRLQKLMGHSDLTMLQRYLALASEDLKEAHRKHGAVDSTLPRLKRH
ncbi:MAG: tyrosine-type recombinase/integrase [Caldilineales bacterium]|nr:tyrosine-type recombinase/integrase [Caldilineales bacterium]